MTNIPTEIERRSFLTATAITSSGLLPIVRGTTQSDHVLEIVSTETAELYYEFVSEGDVQGAETSETISAPGTNDAMTSGTDPETTVVRGHTGNPGYGDAYRLSGDLLFFQQTGGTSDFELRLDDEPISLSDLPQEPDPTTPEPRTYIEREIDDVLSIVTTEEGDLFYELVVDGSVEEATVSDTVSADFDGNDALSTFERPGTEVEVIKGFTGNPGYGDAYAIDGELLSFRTEGGTIDYFFRLGDTELSLAELVDTGAGFPPVSADQEPIAAYRSAIDELDALGQEIGSPTDRQWYNAVAGQLRRAEAAIDRLVEAGYYFDLEVDDELTVEIYEPETPASGISLERSMPLVTTVSVSAIAMTKFVVLPAVATLGAVQTAPYAASAISYLGGQIPTAAQALSQLYASRPSLFLLNSSTIANPRVRWELQCLLSSNASSLLVDNPDLRATAQVIADQAGGCSVDPLDVAEYAAEKFLGEPADAETTLPTVAESVICGSIRNEWHTSGQGHDHSHQYLDERDTFSRATDDRVYMWLRLQNHPPTRTTFEWQPPGGASPRRNSLTVPSPDDGDVWPTRVVWSYIDLGSSVETGDWNVAYDIGSERIAEESFTVQE